MQPPTQNFALGISLGVITAIISSGLAAVAKHLTTMVDVSTIVMFQFLTCFLLTLPWILRNGHKGLATKYPWRHIIRGISGCIALYSFYFALEHTPLMDATLLRSSAPLIVPLVILVIFRSSIPKARWLPLIIGFIGIAIILQPGESGLSLWHLIAFISGIGMALSMVYTRVLTQTEPESRILFYYCFIALLFVTPLFIFSYQTIPLKALPWLIGMGTAMYFTLYLYTRAYSYVKASVLAPTSYFTVVFAGLIDWLIWGHIPDTWTLAGVAIVVSGGLLMLRQGDS